MSKYLNHVIISKSEILNSVSCRTLHLVSRLRLASELDTEKDVERDVRQKQISITKIQNTKPSNLCFEHFNLGFRYCLEFSAWELEFRKGYGANTSWLS